MNERANDEAKATIITCTKEYWISIEEEVREYFTMKWNIWCSEKPEWFTPVYRAQVPLELLPENLREEEKRFRLRDSTGRRQSVVRRLSIAMGSEQ